MAPPHIDGYLTLIADHHRRQLIQQLRDETNGQITIDEFLTQAFQTESIGAHEQPPSRKQLTVELFHIHLPTLADHGVIEYDSETGTVRYQPDEQLEALLDDLPEQVPNARI